MKKKLLFSSRYISARFQLSFLILCVLSALCGESPAQDFKSVHDGVEYAQVDHKIGSDPVKINLLRLDLRKVRLDVHHAMDAAIGTEKTSSIATRHGAVAAINAGFFRLDTSIFAGDAVGILMVDNRLLSESRNGRITIAIHNGADQTDVTFNHLNSKLLLKTQSGDSFVVDGINRERKSDELVIFTREFGESTLTNPDGTEFMFLLPGIKDQYGRLAGVQEDKGSTSIMSNSFIVSATGPLRDKLMRAAIRNRFANWIFTYSLEPANQDRWQKNGDYEDITNGVPQLIKDGKIDITWEQEKSSMAFVETRHPRTAVAKLKDGRFLMVTVDGRQPGVSVGMNLNELASYLLSLGAVDAMNLDGGGSTTMFLDGRVVNKPSDKEGERKVSDALLVTLRKGKSN